MLREIWAKLLHNNTDIFSLRIEIFMINKKKGRTHTYSHSNRPSLTPQIPCMSINMSWGNTEGFVGANSSYTLSTGKGAFMVMRKNRGKIQRCCRPNAFICTLLPSVKVRHARGELVRKLWGHHIALALVVVGFY